MAGRATGCWARIAGPRRGEILPALGVLALVGLGATGCAGTERPIFESLVPTPQSPPPQMVQPPDLPVDAGKNEPPMMTLPPPVTAPDDPDEDGGVRIDPGLDPTATFSWNESLPGRGTCRSGRYVGGFECFMDGAGGWPVSIAGEVVFTLSGSPEKQFLQVEEGAVDGVLFEAPNLEGQLDCTRDEFGAYSNDGTAAFSTGTFQAGLRGTYDDQELGIEGAFTMINDSGDQCEGTFRVWISP